MDNTPEQQNESGEAKQHYSFASLVKALFAGAIGVNSNKNREKDFQQGRLLHFVIGGIVFTLLFILTIAMIVGFVLRNSGQ